MFKEQDTLGRDGDLVALPRRPEDTARRDHRIIIRQTGLCVPVDITIAKIHVIDVEQIELGIVLRAVREDIGPPPCSFLNCSA